MLTHFDLVKKAQSILQEYLAGPYQNDKKTLELLVALFDGPEQREADREAQVTRYSATFTRQIPVPTLERIVYHLHEYSVDPQMRHGMEIHNILKLLVAKLAAKDEGSAPNIPENHEGSLALIPVGLLMHVLMILDNVKAKHEVDEGKLLQVLGDLKEVRPLPKSFISVKPTIEKAVDEIINSQEEVPSTSLSSVDWLSNEKLTSILTKHFGNLFYQVPQKDDAKPVERPELNAALASMDSFLREQFGPATSKYHLARSYLDDIQRARVPRVDMGSAPISPGVQGQPVKQPTDFFPSLPFAEGSFHFEMIELLRAVLNSVAFPTNVSRHAKWYNVFQSLSEQQKLEIKELLIRGLRERGSILNEGKFAPFVSIIDNHETVVKPKYDNLLEEVTFIHQDGNEASPREVLLNIGGQHYTAKQTVQAILRLLGDSGMADQGSKDQGSPGDTRNMHDRTVDDVETQAVAKDNAGAPPDRFRHLMPGMHVWSPIDAPHPVKVMVEQINSRGIVIVHPIQGRRGIQWQNMNEKQRNAVGIVVPE